MKKLMLLTAAVALFATGCGRQWSNSFGCGETQSFSGYAMQGGCCEPSCCDGAMSGQFSASPGFTTGYIPAGPAPILPGPEIVPAPAR